MSEPIYIYTAKGGETISGTASEIVNTVHGWHGDLAMQDNPDPTTSYYDVYHLEQETGDELDADLDAPRKAVPPEVAAWLARAEDRSPKDMADALKHTVPPWQEVVASTWDEFKAAVEHPEIKRILVGVLEISKLHDGSLRGTGYGTMEDAPYEPGATLENWAEWAYINEVAKHRARGDVSKLTSELFHSALRIEYALEDGRCGRIEKAARETAEIAHKLEAARAAAEWEGFPLHN